jgi:hypothetical protein
MQRSVLSLTLLLAAAASCTSPQANIKVRAASSLPEVRGLGEAQAQLALGNVGLALEGFRQVLRDDPTNVDAAVGVAHCYERMGRFDLSQRWFETALASAPEDTAVLNQFAISLDRQGKLSEAARVRAEVANIGAAAPAAAAVNISQAPLTTDVPMDALASVTVKLPAPAPAQETTPISAGKAETVIAAAGATSQTPRLERLSLGEVALITTSKPIWTAQLIRQTPQSVTFRWIEIHPAARLLNAARSEGLAARTRAKLIDNGWHKIEIGDAPAVRANTLVLYPEYRLKAAKRLASQFGFTHLQAFSGSEIVVLLGRDAAALKTLRTT